MSKYEAMTHASANALLADYTANELSSAEHAAVEHHIKQCDACQQALAEIQDIRKLLRTLTRSSGAGKVAETSGVYSTSLVDAVMIRLKEQKDVVEGSRGL